MARADSRLPTSTPLDGASTSPIPRALRRSLLVAMVGLAAVLAAPSARAAEDDAQARITARKLGAEAIKLYDTGYHSAALEKFDAASSLVPAPTLHLYAARCLVKLGRLVEASERYLAATRMTLDKKAPAVMLRAQVDAAVEREKLLPTIPQVKIEVSGPTGAGVKIQLDGREVARAMLGEKIPVDPGKHAVRAERADTSVGREISLSPGESSQILLALPPLPPPPAPITPMPRVAGWVGLGVGAAGLAAFAANGAVALALGDSLTGDPMCADNLCDPKLSGKVADYGAARVATTVGLVVGLAGLGAGLPLVLLNPIRMPAGAQVSPFFGPGSLGLHGSF